MSHGHHQFTCGEQGSATGPIYVVQPSGSARYPAIPGFLQHRSNMATDAQPQRSQPIPTLQSVSQTALHSGYVLNTADLPTNGSSTFAAPHPIIMPSPSFQLHSFDAQQGPSVQNGGTAQSSPLQPVTPYDMASQEYSSSARRPSGLEQGRGYMSRTNVSSATEYSPQGMSMTYVYSQSPHAHTSLSMAQANALYYAPLGINASQGNQQAIQPQHPISGQQNAAPQMFQPAPLYGFPPYPSNMTEYPPQYRAIPAQPTVPVTQAFASSSQGNSAGSGNQPSHPGQEVLQQSLPSSSVQQITPSLPSGPQYGPSGAGPYFTAVQMQQSQSQPITNRPTMISTQLPDGSTGATWIRTNPVSEQQNRLPAGFTHSHSRNPGFNRGGLMISEDAEEEEYTSTLSYDPYMVSLAVHS